LSADVLVVSGKTVTHTKPDGTRVAVRSYPDLRVPSRVLLAAGIQPDDVLSVSSPRPGILVMRVEIESDDRLPERILAEIRERHERDPDPEPFF